MKFAKAISLILAGITASAVLSACSTPATNTSITASAGTEEYISFLEGRLDAMPSSLIIASGDDTAAYGVDTSAFIDDEGYTIRAADGEVVILGKNEKGIDRAVRQFAKYGNNDSYTFTYGEGYRVKRLTINGNDISEYAIVRADDGDACMVFASNELAAYIKKTCGAVIPEYTRSEYDSAEDKPARVISLTVDYPNLGNEAFTIDVKNDGNIDIHGGRYRGCMYAVYDLLRDIGWRFLSDPTMNYVEYLYEADHVDITADLSRTEEPAIAQRSFWDGGSGAFEKNKSNLKVKLFGNQGYGVENKAKYGGYGLVPPATHGLQRFDYDGYYDTASGGQPCFTDEDILQVIEDNVVNTIQSKLDKGQQIGREICSIDVSQYDIKWFCMCDTCVKGYAKDGISGVVLQMTNRMADVVAEQFSPEISVTMLAYCETISAPKVTTPRKNVKIAYCFYVNEGNSFCSKHSIHGEECGDTNISNGYFAKHFNDWSAICPSSNMQVWYYPHNGYGSAFMSPIYNIAYDDMKYLVSKNIDCLMVCAHDSTGVTNHFLPNYLCSVMAWDPDITREEYDALIREYCDIVYGDAGVYIYQYMMMCEDAGQSAPGCWSASFSKVQEKVSKKYMADNFDTFWELYELALDAADTAHQEKLCELYMSGIMYACIGITHTDRYINNSDPEDKTEFEHRHKELHRIFTENKILIDGVQNVYMPKDFNPMVNPFSFDSAEKS